MGETARHREGDVQDRISARSSGASGAAPGAGAQLQGQVVVAEEAVEGCSGRSAPRADREERFSRQVVPRMRARLIHPLQEPRVLELAANSRRSRVKVSLSSRTRRPGLHTVGEPVIAVGQVEDGGADLVKTSTSDADGAARRPRPPPGGSGRRAAVSRRSSDRLLIGGWTAVYPRALPRAKRRGYRPDGAREALQGAEEGLLPQGSRSRRGGGQEVGKARAGERGMSRSRSPFRGAGWRGAGPAPPDPSGPRGRR